MGISADPILQRVELGICHRRQPAPTPKRASPSAVTSGRNGEKSVNDARPSPVRNQSAEPRCRLCRGGIHRSYPWRCCSAFESATRRWGRVRRGVWRNGGLWGDTAWVVAAQIPSGGIHRRFSPSALGATGSSIGLESIPSQDSSRTRFHVHASPACACPLHFSVGRPSRWLDSLAGSFWTSPGRLCRGEAHAGRAASAR